MMYITVGVSFKTELLENIAVANDATDKGFISKI